MIQETLFQNLDLAPPKRSRSEIESARAKRYQAMNKAAQKAGEAFRAPFRDFFVCYLTEHAQATTEEIRNAYLKTDLPKPENWKAAGKVVSDLSREKVIKTVGTCKSPTRRALIPVFALA